MPTPRADPEQDIRIANEYAKLVAQGRNFSEAAGIIGVPRTTLQAALARAKQRAHWRPEHAAVVTVPPDVDDLDDLIEARKRAFKRKRASEEASRLIPVTVKMSGPIGILHFGDPHVDDDGTDIEALEAHTDLCNRTPGLFAANIGDTTNNWTGRLARLYAEQSTTAKQAWMLAEWFVKRCKWLYMIGGNHDAWSGAGDPLQWIARGQTYLNCPSEARMALAFPKGRVVRVNARHDHSGHSMWNPAHGAMKALQIGLRDHIAVAGHKHTSGYGVIKDPDSGIVCHAMQIGSYKVYDRFAKEKGFRDQQFSPCALTVINPELPDTDPDMIKVFWNAFEGAEYLAFKRRKA